MTSLPKPKDLKAPSHKRALERELNELKQNHYDALHHAIYIRATAAEDKDDEARVNRIAELQRLLTEIKETA
jgi:hypothetical protein